VPVFVGRGLARARVRVADPAALSLVALVISLLSAGALVVPIRALLRGPMHRLREE
jgi:hypothetical protein